MKERTVIFFIFSACFYLYSVYVLFTNTNILKMWSKPKVEMQSDVTPNMSQLKDVTDAKKISLSPKNACSVLEVFLQKPKKNNIKRRRYEEDDTTTITFIAVSILLMLLLLNALCDVLCEKELEKCKKVSKSKGERKQSLAEFANKKMVRRESSKFGQQLSQIEESVAAEGDKTSREARPYMRGDSMNSYLSEKSKKTENYTAASDAEMDTKPVKRQSVAKPSGVRPAPMVRRSSYPALQNPEVQCLALGSKQGSLDSDDEDAKGRRVRILRRS